MRYLTNSLILIASFIAIFIEEQFASDYRTQIIGLLILAYFLITFLRRKYKRDKDSFNSGSDIFIVSTIVLLLIIATNGLYSPIFFLLYFLCFGITFIFEPVTVFIFAIGSALLFLPDVLKNYALESFIKIGSIFIIAPLAFFFGREYKTRVKQDQLLSQQKQDAKTISTDIKKVINNNKNLTTDDKKTLDDALDTSAKLDK